MTYSCVTSGPIEVVADGSEQQIWEITEATIEGDGIRATLAGDWDDQCMRRHMTFQTGDQRYRWLTESLFVARGRLLGTGRVGYEVYRLA